MKNMSRSICIILFFLLCMATASFLNAFTNISDPLIHVEWQSASRIDQSGHVQPFEITEYSGAPHGSEGEYFAFETTIDRSMPGAYLLFEISGAEIELRLDEELIYSSSFAQPAKAINLGQVHIPLPEDAAGRKLVMTWRSLEDGNSNVLFPPLLRITSDAAAQADVIAYANRYGIPTGMFGLIFLLICGLLLFGISSGKADWSLIPLAIAAAGLMMREISISCGYMFLPKPMIDVFACNWVSLLVPLSILAYLLFNRKRLFWKQLGYISLFSAASLLVVYLISLLRGSYLSGYINDSVIALFQYGDYSRPVYWLTFFLALACAAIAITQHIISFSKIQADSQILKVRNELILDSYHAIERGIRQTASMRHELKNYIAALHLLYQQGKMKELGEHLEKLDQQQAALTQIQFTENFIVNAILQNAAMEASKWGIRFDAQAMVPCELEISEDDLCSFLMNLLDNAMEACRNLPDDATRFIIFNMELKDKYLAISCKNSYNAHLAVSEETMQPETTKQDKAIHGFGLRQMRIIAERYDSVLNISYTGNEFTVQTALKIKDTKLKS